MPIDIQGLKQRFGIIGNSPLLVRAMEVAVQVASTDMSVLIIGESGVGKEVFPKIIHQSGLRKHGPYIAVNCGAIPEGTIDSELFGHVKGSFTGAMNDRKGYFQEANGGTIFLDEVGELPLSTQARLLRVLETGEFIPVGASTPLKTDVRIVAATNVNMQDAVSRGRFREDLLFRLNTVPIELPPLRKRPEDISLLFRYFAAQAAEKYHMPTLRLEAEAVQLLEHYRWPGNIRELRNLADRISVLEEERMVSAEILQRYLPQAMTADYRPALRQTEPFIGSSREGEPMADTSVLLSMLFEMRKEINELRGMISTMRSQPMPQSYSQPATPTLEPYTPTAGYPLAGSVAASDEREVYQATPIQPLAVHQPSPTHTTHAEDVEVMEVETSDTGKSLEEVEKQMIIQALQRHKGRRRSTAEELKISERTLYRKIKEYGLDI